VDSATDGHCSVCGLHHRRRDATVPWVRVIGPVVVTVLDLTGGEEQAIEADTLRFVGKYLTIDLTRGSERHIISLPARRIADIVPRD
jgi:hypothetical protein